MLLGEGIYQFTTKRRLTGKRGLRKEGGA